MRHIDTRAKWQAGDTLEIGLTDARADFAKVYEMLVRSRILSYSSWKSSKIVENSKSLRHDPSENITNS